MTAALEGGELSATRLGHNLPPGKTLYPLYRRPGGPQSRSGRAENLVPIGIRSRTVQPVVSRYTDGATGPTTSKYPLSISMNAYLCNVGSCSRRFGCIWYLQIDKEAVSADI